MSEVKRIDVNDIIKVVADVLGYLDTVKENLDSIWNFNPDAIDAVKVLIIHAFVDKVEADNRICPF